MGQVGFERDRWDFAHARRVVGAEYGPAGLQVSRAGASEVSRARARPHEPEGFRRSDDLPHAGSNRTHVYLRPPRPNRIALHGAILAGSQCPVQRTMFRGIELQRLSFRRRRVASASGQRSDDIWSWLRVAF